MHSLVIMHSLMIMRPDTEQAPAHRTARLPAVTQDAPVLVACAHGTRSATGRRAMAQLRLDVAALRPGLRVVPASVDVQKPALTDVVRRLTRAGTSCVVVPMLLAAGYHVRVDVREAVAAGSGRALAAPALGPDPALIDVLADRLAEAAPGPDDTIVLGAAGSSDPHAVADVEQVAAELAARVRRPVTVGYLSAASPTVTDAVASARGGGRPVTLVTFLLSPGFFADKLAGAGADRVTAALAPHPRLAELVLRRYDEALSA
jgi:sirohydrochlorin ferrochelatase